MTTFALRFRNVKKEYADAGAPGIAPLDCVSFDVSLGDTIAIVGRSGSGKSTLLHLAAGIDLPSSGTVRAFGSDLSLMTERERTRFRRDDIGLVFQFFHLMPHLTVGENVALPELIAGTKSSVFRPRVQHLLERVGLADRASETVQKLSGGEMQRVAICRALIRQPRLLLADEPTGNLDSKSGLAVMEQLNELNQEGSTVVMVTHSLHDSKFAHRVIHLFDGRIQKN